jgi:phage protein D/phage baseplate assembly protein gpV
MSTAIGTLAPLVKVDGTELAATVLNAMIGLKISSGLRIPSRATLEFLDDGFAVTSGGHFRLGSTVTVSTTDRAFLFTGEVTGVDLDIEAGAPNLRVTADDAAYKMTLGNKVRTFTTVSYADVASTIAREYGLSISATPDGTVQDYLLQTDSDFGYLTEIADRIGYDWWVDATGVLQFHPMNHHFGNAAPSVGWNEGLRSFSVRASALHPQQVTVHGWDAAGNLSVSSKSEDPTAAPTADLVQPYLTAGSLSGQSAVQTAFRMFAKQADGQAIADAVAARAQASAVVATGVCLLLPTIVVGGAVTVTDVGPASGKYPVTEVEHLYSLRGFETRFVAGDREPTALVDTLAGPITSSFRQESLVVGIVTNLGSSSSPKGYVKVKFPTLGDQVESAWARVVSTGAGGSRGMTFLPEVNDEVIVGFESGDVTRPLVTGGLYTSKNAALEYGTENGSVAKRQIVSRLGHVIELGDGDSPADQRIAMTLAGGDFSMVLSKQGLAGTVPAGQPVTIKAGDTKVELDKQGNITLSGKKITIAAEMDVEISGLNVKLKSNANLEGAAGAALKMSANATADLSASGPTSIKGAMVTIN